MSDMKCPFCQQELGIGSIDRKWLVCFNCHITGEDKLWQELISTRKALDVARHTIGWINQMIDEHIDKQAIKIKCEYALEQITALEQKD